MNAAVMMNVTDSLGSRCAEHEPPEQGSSKPPVRPRDPVRRD
jgi:hypothetical protein